MAWSFSYFGQKWRWKGTCQNLILACSPPPQPCNFKFVCSGLQRCFWVGWMAFFLAAWVVRLGACFVWWGGACFVWCGGNFFFVVGGCGGIYMMLLWCYLWAQTDWIWWGLEDIRRPKYPAGFGARAAKNTQEGVWRICIYRLVWCVISWPWINCRFPVLAQFFCQPQHIFLPATTFTVNSLFQNLCCAASYPLLDDMKNYLGWCLQVWMLASSAYFRMMLKTGISHIIQHRQQIT